MLPDREDIDLPVLRKIEQLVRAGATVVGRKPTGSNGLTDYPNRDRQVRELAEEMWGDCDGKAVTHHPLGRGQIIWGPSLREILLKRGVPPDFQFASREPQSAQGDDQLDFIHRRTDDADIYFVRNMRPQAARSYSDVSSTRQGARDVVSRDWGNSSLRGLRADCRRGARAVCLRALRQRLRCVSPVRR